MPRGRGRPRKVKPKLTKTERFIQAYKQDCKLTSSERKKTIVPGPWTGLKTELKVEALLRPLKSVCERFGAIQGVYRDDSAWKEKGWYPITINIACPKLEENVIKYGIDQVLAACEASLNQTQDYGTLVIMYLFSDNSQQADSNCFLSCLAKTNKKRIEGFLAWRKGQLGVISNQSAEAQLEESIKSST
jgi:hypothetical protein